MYKTIEENRIDRRYFTLASALSLTEFKLRYFDSVFGYLWTLARPLMLFGVLYLVFTTVVKFGEGVSHYAVVILLGIVLWFFFAEATSGAVNSLVSREDLIRKMSFPLSVIPVSVGITAVITLLLNLVAVFIFMAASGVEPNIRWLELPLILGALIAVAFPLVLLLSVLYVRFRDIQHIWDVALQMGFYASPIIYPIERVPEHLQKFVMFNPVALLIEQARYALVDPTAPSAITAIGGVSWLLVPAGIVLLLYVAALLVFRRQSPQVAELI